MYIQRLILEDIKEYQKFFPVLLISGARQVGKSTLALHLNIDNYITLDDINMYEMAKNNPKGFIESLSKPVVIDEICTSGLISGLNAAPVVELFVDMKNWGDPKDLASNRILPGTSVDADK